MAANFWARFWRWITANPVAEMREARNKALRKLYCRSCPNALGQDELDAGVCSRCQESAR